MGRLREEVLRIAERIVSLRSELQIAERDFCALVPDDEIEFEAKRQATGHQSAGPTTEVTKLQHHKKPSATTKSKQKRGRPPTMTQEQRGAAISFRTAGKSWREIEDLIGVDAETARRTIRDDSQSPRGKKWRGTKKTTNAALRKPRPQSPSKSGWVPRSKIERPKQVDTTALPGTPTSKGMLRCRVAECQKLVRTENAALHIREEHINLVDKPTADLFQEPDEGET